MGFNAVQHATSCLIAGSASTIAMLKGEDEGLAWLETLGLSLLCVRANGEVVDRFSGERS
jgi:thiamine biosynthesis lipoprotein